MGGGERGGVVVVGESGHRSLRPGDSRPGLFTGVLDEAVLLPSSIRRAGLDSHACRELLRTSCFSAVTGPAAKPNLEKDDEADDDDDDDGGVAGVMGVDTPGDGDACDGILTDGTW